MTDNLEKLVSKRTAELEEANKKLSEQATTDALTGIYNRLELANIMKNEDARYRRTGKLYAALYMDLDNFKYINDTFGHPAGDFILKNFAAMMKTVVRDSDYLFRIGGDEFFILMTEIKSEREAEILADRILSQLKESSYLKNELENFLKTKITISKSKKFSLSIGISSTENSRTESLQSITAQADLALLKAKAQGKNCYAHYNR